MKVEFFPAAEQELIEAAADYEGKVKCQAHTAAKRRTNVRSPSPDFVDLSHAGER
jgi:hypothetical protein